MLAASEREAARIPLRGSGSIRCPELNFSRRAERAACVFCGESDTSAAQYNRSSIRLCVAVLPSRTFERSAAAEGTWRSAATYFSLSPEKRKGGRISTTRRGLSLYGRHNKEKQKSGGAWVLSCDSNFPMPPLSAARCRCGLVVLALRVRSYFAFCGFPSAERIHAYSGFPFLQLVGC